MNVVNIDEHRLLMQEIEKAEALSASQLAELLANIGLRSRSYKEHAALLVAARKINFAND